MSEAVSPGEVASIVLSVGGYSVDVLDGTSEGMHEVKIGYGVATGSTSFVYGFDGKGYKKIPGAASK